MPIDHTIPLCPLHLKLQKPINQSARYRNPQYRSPPLNIKCPPKPLRFRSLLRLKDLNSINLKLQSFLSSLNKPPNQSLLVRLLMMTESHQPCFQSPEWDDRVDRLTSSPPSPQHSVLSSNPSVVASPDRVNSEQQLETIPYSVTSDRPPPQRHRPQQSLEPSISSRVAQIRVQQSHRVKHLP